MIYKARRQSNPPTMFGIPNYQRRNLIHEDEFSIEVIAENISTSSVVINLNNFDDLETNDLSKYKIDVQLIEI